MIKASLRLALKYVPPLQFIFLIAITTVSAIAQATESIVELSASKYSVYFGDFNNDGVSGDVYLRTKPKIILIHGAVAIPITISGGAGVIYHSGSESTPIWADLSASELNSAIEGVEGQDYQFGDTSGDGISDLTIHIPGVNGSDISLIGSSAAGEPAFVDNNVLPAHQFDTPPTPVLGDASVVSSTAQNNMDKFTTIGADFRVSQGGSATYSIPFMVAHGTAGVAPSLGLYYSSQASNGIAGWGWALQGLTSIGRCRQTTFQDKNNTAISWGSDDRFCYNGARLVVVSGVYGAPDSTYRTAIDSHVLVTAKGGDAFHPDYFEVLGKDGTTTTYGSPGGLGNADQAGYLDAVKQSGRVLNWNISEFRDNVGNKITYEYLDSQDDYLISSAKYAYGHSATAGAEVQFIYEPRDDQSMGYVSGYPFRNTQRLAHVSSYNTVNGVSAEIRRYELNYHAAADFPDDDLSRLGSVSLCAAGVCHSEAATSFTWGTGNLALETDAGFTFNDTNYTNMVDYKFPDINGDGVSDLAMATVIVDQANLEYRYNLTVQVSGTSNVGILSSFAGDFETTKFEERINVLDYNGDGRQDIVFNGKVYVSEPQANGSWALVEASEVSLGEKP
ncbi:MAG: hypothetical protein COA42_16715, partial [Alteromonadaceae bacterium]